MSDINLMTQDIALETRNQGQKLNRIDTTLQTTKENVEQGNDQLDQKL